MKPKVAILFAIVSFMVPDTSFVISPGIIQNPNYRWNIGIGPFYGLKYRPNIDADLRRIYKSMAWRFYKHEKSEQKREKIEESRKKTTEIGLKFDCQKVRLRNLMLICI